MTDQSNAHRLLLLFERMRHGKPDSAFLRLQELRLSFSHVHAMHVLLPDRALPMKDLADALDLTPPSVTALTRRLVQTGMIKRETDQHDSRISLLSLTDDGRALLRTLYEQRLHSMARLLEGLTADEQEQFLNLMERAVNALHNGDEAGSEDAL